MNLNRKECGNNVRFRDLFCFNPEEGEISSDSIAGFCADSASIPREFISRLESESGDLNTDDNRICKSSPTDCQDSGLRM